MKLIFDLGKMGTNVLVSVYEEADSLYTIETWFAGNSVQSNVEYSSENLAISDAHTIFYLLNGLGEILNRVTE